MEQYEYADCQVEAQCEHHASVYLRLKQNKAKDAAEMGRCLERVYILLNRCRPAFLHWVDACLGISETTATNQRNWAAFVDDNQNALGLSSMRLAYQVAALPAEVRDDVVDRGAFTEAEARVIIREHQQRAWTEQMETYLAKGEKGLPTSWEKRYGDVLHWAREKVHENGDLRDAAVDLLKKHSDAFARLSGRETHEVLVEAGVTRNERWSEPEPGRVFALLRENLNGDRCPTCGSRANQRPFEYDQLEVRVNGSWHFAATFKRPDDPAVRSVQRRFVEAGVDAVGARTVDDFGGEYL